MIQTGLQKRLSLVETMKLLFWLIVCFDLAVLMLFFVLGLAAAVSSKTSFFVVAGYMLVVPGLFLLGSILLFVRSSATGWRVVALLLAASPIIVAFVSQRIADADLGANMDQTGKLTFFREGPLRKISTAISSNDAAAVKALAPGVKLNEHGMNGKTLLLLALEQLRKTPTQLEVLRALVQAGADPNIGAAELPLELALQTSSKTGLEPVTLLLAAGAKPNTKTQFGTPMFFNATGRAHSRELLRAVLDAGADLKTRDSHGGSVVFFAATTANWPAVLLLLERGVEWKADKDINGRGLVEKVEAHNRNFPNEPGLAEVLQYLGTH